MIQHAVHRWKFRGIKVHGHEAMPIREVCEAAPADTFGVRRFDYIVQAVVRAGTGKVLFGPDGPWLHSGVALHEIRLLRLPPEQEALILGGNVARLMRDVTIAPRGTPLPSTRAGSAYPRQQLVATRNELRAIPGAQLEYAL